MAKVSSVYADTLIMDLVKTKEYYIELLERYIKGLEESKKKIDDPERDRAIDDKIKVYKSANHRLEDAETALEIEEAIEYAKEVMHAN